MQAQRRREFFLMLAPVIAKAFALHIHPLVHLDRLRNPPALPPLLGDHRQLKSVCHYGVITNEALAYLIRFQQLLLLPHGPIVHALVLGG